MTVSMAFKFGHESKHGINGVLAKITLISCFFLKTFFKGLQCILCKRIPLVIGGEYRTTVLFFFLFTLTPCFGQASEVDLGIIAQIETGGHPNPAKAIGDDGMSLGRFQVSKQMLKDFNQVNQTNIPADRLFDEATNAHVAIWFLTTRIPQVFQSLNPPIPVTKDRVIMAYNGGFHRNPSKQARNYLKKYKRFENATI